MKRNIIVLPFLLFHLGCVEDDPLPVSFLYELKNSTESDIAYCVSTENEKKCDTLAFKDSVIFEKEIDSLLLGDPCCRSYTLVEYHTLGSDSNIELETKVIYSKYYAEIGYNVDFIQAEFRAMSNQ